VTHFLINFDKKEGILIYVTKSQKLSVPNDDSTFTYSSSDQLFLISRFLVNILIIIKVTLPASAIMVMASGDSYRIFECLIVLLLETHSFRPVY